MPEVPNCFYRTSVKALILDEQKRFLLAREDNGFWELPGGGLDFGENPHDCLVRELQEEMGLEATFINDQPSYFVTIQHTNGVWKANVLYEVKLKDLDFTPSSECVEVRFFTPETAASENLFPIVKEFVKVYRAENH